jgi:hypothetical protein
MSWSPKARPYTRILGQTSRRTIRRRIWHSIAQVRRRRDTLGTRRRGTFSASFRLNLGIVHRTFFRLSPSRRARRTRDDEVASPYGRDGLSQRQLIRGWLPLVRRHLNRSRAVPSKPVTGTQVAPTVDRLRHVGMSCDTLVASNVGLLTPPRGRVSQWGSALSLLIGDSGCIPEGRGSHSCDGSPPSNEVRLAGRSWDRLPGVRNRSC